MLLARKQIYGSMEQKGEPRNKSTHLQSIFNKGGKNIQNMKTVSLGSDVEKAGQLHVCQ